MIDFHSHILPNVDDGSKSVEDTFEMLKEAEKAGFEAVISTSHYIEGYYEVDVKEREIWIKALTENLYKDGINLKLFLGNEIYLSTKIIEFLETGKATTINNSKYVLFEFPLNTKPLDMFDIIYDMLQNRLVPVLAHPERYSFVQKEPELVYELIQKGVLMQSNYGSIIGMYGSKAEFIVRKLFENNMVHFLGTDVHRRRSVYTKVPEILNVIKPIIGKEKLNELTTINPQKVLNNENIEIDEPNEYKLSLTEKIKMNLNK